MHTTANTHATTPNIVGATMLGVVAPVCTQPKLVLILIIQGAPNIVGATMLGVVAPVCTQPKLVLILILQGAPLGLAVEMN